MGTVPTSLFRRSEFPVARFGVPVPCCCPAGFAHPRRGASSLPVARRPGASAAWPLAGPEDGRAVKRLGTNRVQSLEFALCWLLRSKASAVWTTRPRRRLRGGGGPAAQRGARSRTMQQVESDERRSRRFALAPPPTARRTTGVLPDALRQPVQGRARTSHGGSPLRKSPRGERAVFGRGRNRNRGNFHFFRFSAATP